MRMRRDCRRGAGFRLLVARLVSLAAAAGALAIVASARVPASTSAHIARAAAASSLAATETAPLALGGWQATELDLPRAWQVTDGNPSVVVAVVDTGVQADHAALSGRVLPGRNLVDNTNDATDDNGHGTAAGGIVAATCPRCRILPVKVLAANGTGDWGTIAAGIVWAADHGAQVINLSVGAPRALDVLGSAVSHALAKGAIVVAAAGNDGRDERFYPAAYPGVVSVAGVDASGARYPWSNYGAWVSVTAPGCSVTTWLAGGYTQDFCGTSTAAPFVAGVAGLARSYRNTLTPEAFAAALRASARPLPDPSIASLGAVDADRLLRALGGAPAQPRTPRTAVLRAPR